MPRTRAHRWARTKLSISLLLVSTTHATWSCDCRGYEMPILPKQISGWKTQDTDGIKIVGDLVLKVGQRSDNGRLGVVVLDIQPPKKCTDNAWSSTPRTTLRFYRKADNEVICEDSWQPGGLNLKPFCGNALAVYGVYGLYLEINSNENWVHVQLRG